MELELPQQNKIIPDHPDAKKLDKRNISGDDFSPLDNGRRCTDCLFLILIVCSWVAMTGLGLAATGIVPSEYIRQGGKLYMCVYSLSKTICSYHLNLQPHPKHNISICENEQIQKDW